MIQQMDLCNLGAMIDTAVSKSPPQEVQSVCIGYYAPYYFLLWELAHWYNHGLFVELGVEKGRGVGSWAAGTTVGQAIGFDVVRCADLDLVLAKYPNITFYQESAMPPKHVEPESVNVLFIDIEHGYDSASDSFLKWKPYLAKWAVVLFDDLHAMENGVLCAFSEFSYPKIQDDRLHPINGFGVLIYV